MQETEFQFAGAQGTELPARLWLPDGQPRFVLQISHGMTEHSGRYDTLAAALAEHGIACAAFDLRGHGRNPGSRTCADMGPDGWEQSLSDLRPGPAAPGKARRYDAAGAEAFLWRL